MISISEFYDRFQVGFFLILSTVKFLNILEGFMNFPAVQKKKTHKYACVVSYTFN